MKSETRNPKPETNPKFEARSRRLCRRHGLARLGIRISNFLRISDFGLRNCPPDHA